MNTRTRQVLLMLGALGLASLFAVAFRGMPAVGRGASAYGDLITRAAVPERSATDAVSAVNFDYRGFDTLGEEYILFVSVLGVSVVLRRQKHERDEDDDEDDDRGRPPAGTSDAVRVLGVGLVGVTVCFGLYLCTHGQVSPGGGFQGGVVLATAPVVVYLAADARTFARIAPPGLVKAAEAIGTAGYVLVGLCGFVRSAPFLSNVLPLGTPGDVFSSGTIAVIDVLVGLGVAAGLVSLVLTFVAETLARRLKRMEPR